MRITCDEFYIPSKVMDFRPKATEVMAAAGESILLNVHIYRFSTNGLTAFFIEVVKWYTSNWNTISCLDFLLILKFTPIVRQLF